jgi:hypothetical protein
MTRDDTRTGAAKTLRGRMLIVFSLLALFSDSRPSQAEAFPGGFLEPATSAKARRRLTRAQIQALLPQRGKFRFPAPYGTDAVRITNATDCGGKDCLNYVGYSYWRNMNNHVGSDTILIFLGMSPDRRGSGPTLFRYNKLTDAVTSAGPLFDPTSPFRYSSGEGWYFSATLPTKLYISDATRLYRYDVVTKALDVVFDIRSAEAVNVFGAERRIWQMHSSNDDRVHSATVRSASYEALGTLVYREDIRQYSYYPTAGDFDEAQIDKSGRWLVIKEQNNDRIVDIETGVETLLLDRDGAGGHSDLGYGYMVAADNWWNAPGAQRLWVFDESPLRGILVSHGTSWRAGAPDHISHANARPDLPPGRQYVVGSGVSRKNVARGNEIIAFRLDGSLDEILVIAPVMTKLGARGGGSEDARYPKGNVDVTGEYFLWTDNMAGNRLDAFIVKIPAHLLLN